MDDIRMNAGLLNSITGKKREIDRFRPFPSAVVRKLDEQFTLEWTYNSNAIEGNTLSLQETELVINRGLTVGGKSLAEHFEAINHNQAVMQLTDYIQKKQDISIDLILNIHKTIFKNIDETEAGKFRNHNVRIMGAVHLPPDAGKIPRLMDELIEWYYQHLNALSAPELAAAIHYKTVHIHPFMDGNGRTARILMNLVLMKNGFPPAVILNVDRKKYYRVLKEADMGKYDGFMDFIGKSVERSLIIYLNALEPADLKKNEKRGYITLKEATRYCDYSQEYLSFLARQGRLSAVKFNRNWMTTKEAVEEYVKTVNAV